MLLDAWCFSAPPSGELQKAFQSEGDCTEQMGLCWADKIKDMPADHVGIKRSAGFISVPGRMYCSSN